MEREDQKRYLIDTNTLRPLILEDEEAEELLAKIAQESLSNDVSISAIAFYEVLRGLVSIGKTGKAKEMEFIEKKFRIKCLDSLKDYKTAANITEFDEEDSEDHHRDMLMAGQAIHRESIIVTEDTDFDGIEGLQTENWLKQTTSD